ncbi:DUF2690 domain-containing protein [Streptomyces sp. NPDC048664]|uniref:helix-turn-helix domain-containing protein n=1 Tax=Streptomyces sp. NPDC048664 TaxID=3154505 RepID=UPI003430A901
MRAGAARAQAPGEPEAAEPGQPDGPFATRLRALKDRTGLSLAALAARTPYSKSAWHRYLNGAQRPPRSAVEALARLAGDDPGPVLALWETSEHAAPADPEPHEDGDVHRAHPVDGAEPTARTARLPRPPLPAVALGVVAAAVAVTLVATHPSGTSDGRRAPVSPSCRGASCEGRLPSVSACDRDAQTKNTVRASSYAVRLEYSPSCRAAWAEVQARASDARVISVRSGRDVLSAQYPGDGSAGTASPMLAVTSPEGVEACAVVDGKLACTGLDADAADER